MSAPKRTGQRTRWGGAPDRQEARAPASGRPDLGEAASRSAGPFAAVQDRRRRRHASARFGRSLPAAGGLPRVAGPALRLG